MKKYNPYSEMLESSDERGGADVKYNLFRFQDHIIRWLSVGSDCFFMKDYGSAFEAYQNVYLDCKGFFEKEELEELEKLYQEAYRLNVQYNNYQVIYDSNGKRKMSYSPPLQIYPALCKFRSQLLFYMAKHNMLIPIIKKGFGKVFEMV